MADVGIVGDCLEIVLLLSKNIRAMRKGGAPVTSDSVPAAVKS